MSDLMVTKSNALLDASYQLSARAQKLMLCCVAKLNPKDKPKPEMSITASEYAEILGMEMSDDVYRDLHAAADALFDAYISIREDDATMRYRWVQEDAVKHSGEGTVTLMWSNRILRHLHDLNRDFKSYHIKNIANLDTGHAIRLYELLIKFESTGWREMSLEGFKASMGIADKYPSYGELNRRVITPAVKQLNKSSNLTVKLTTKKKGRKIVGLRFDFKVDDQMQLDLEESSTAGRSKSKNLSKMADENTKNLVAKYGKKQA
ncbi:putative replication initiation protein [Alteromonas macleodii str. 'English Channel 673']|uniref:Replication initiation protein n=1 Tax=Alteromonas macleodii (strain English Channel 673) TaxID=1004788 RepID=A0AB32ZTV4_ALTME|nr:replication initiation protein [Alteromonas macleodii]AFT72948.1 putative replication initiation protein [Alteromonas macleodii str. 'English Channel 673']AFT72950.1 putative replication initiation protein [Alteromonas macleodii str. 'English Channel 673']AFT72952.1 putative replication initiation protein [Alteromonas macleodii str. 'English Channel 673']